MDATFIARNLMFNDTIKAPCFGLKALDGVRNQGYGNHRKRSCTNANVCNPLALYDTKCFPCRDSLIVSPT